MYLFIELQPFSRAREGVLSDDELSALQSHLASNPDAGDVVPGSGGVRKLRWSRSGGGKRGGLRVLYYVQDSHGRIWLLTLYAKSAQENIAPATLRALRRMVDHAEIE